MIHEGVRLWLEEREEALSPLAARSRLSRGREKPESPSPMRTEFQRDRDRILYAKAFRRLKHKTQVFIAPLSDHFVTRLTHTLEVAQIARSIARALNLNEDLAEAIALGHDLGHTPFGHVGEEVLNELFEGGFRHNEQSLRVVDRLENEGQGLNLTWEVREGILKHSKTRESIMGEVTPATLEGQVCKLADIVAYINHDTADALRSGLITEGDLPSEAAARLGSSTSQRINTLVCDIVDTSWGVTGRGASTEKTSIAMSPPVLEAANTLREFLFQRVYNERSLGEEARKAKETLHFLYRYLIAHPDRVPKEYPGEEGVARGVVDYVAGMTDQFALRMAEDMRR